MKFLIAEEALTDRRGHWFEYIATISKQHKASGDTVKIAANSKAIQEILDELNADPVFPSNAWRTDRKNQSSIGRLKEVWDHNSSLFNSMDKYIEENGNFDVLFVPTILIDHILGWRKFAKKHAGKSVKKIVLFFVNGQGVYHGPDKPISFPSSPKKWLFKHALNSLKPEVENGSVLFGCETREMAKEYETFCGLPFHYLPHAVNDIPLEKDTDTPKQAPITFAQLGFSRFEKGTDLLQEAIVKFLKDYPEADVRFVLQWLSNFEMGNGAICRKHPDLLSSPKVEFIEKALDSTGYESVIKETDVMVLPYRLSSYYARVSRVAIEAAINSIPMIFTKKSWNESLVKDGHGAGEGFESENIDSLYQAIARTVENIESLRTQAEERKTSALEHYSAATFEAYLKSITGYAQTESVVESAP